MSVQRASSQSALLPSVPPPQTNTRSGRLQQRLVLAPAPQELISFGSVRRSLVVVPYAQRLSVRGCDPPRSDLRDPLLSPPPIHRNLLFDRFQDQDRKIV